uniref:Uncharacterized protein n=1 Tax=Asparagus officinalis TaxID=4686 RepID=Q2AA92_ASPOF|nr:hypothetical protein 17.t00013 [Asparagus officinalis]
MSYNIFSYKILDTLDAVLDVGGVYDPDRDRYDHHQKGFTEVLEHGFNTKLSSAGLVYKDEFLRDQISAIYHLVPEAFNKVGDYFSVFLLLIEECPWIPRHRHQRSCQGISSLYRPSC